MLEWFGKVPYNTPSTSKSLILVYALAVLYCFARTSSPLLVAPKVIREMAASKRYIAWFCGVLPLLDGEESDHDQRHDAKVIHGGA